MVNGGGWDRRVLSWVHHDQSQQLLLLLLQTVFWEGRWGEKKDPSPLEVPITGSTGSRPKTRAKREIFWKISHRQHFPVCTVP